MPSLMDSYRWLLWGVVGVFIARWIAKSRATRQPHVIWQIMHASSRLHLNPESDRHLAFSRHLCAACIVIIFAASFLASQVQTSWGRVRVTGIRLPTQNGQWVVADLYRPLSATSEKPAPLVVVVPGFQRSKETQVNIALELARRSGPPVEPREMATGNLMSSKLMLHVPLAAGDRPAHHGGDLRL